MSNWHWIKKIRSCLRYFFKFQWIYSWRKICLLVFAFCGWYLFCAFVNDELCPNLIQCIKIENAPNGRIRTSLALLFLGLPMAYLLWLFRTHDTRENINRPAFFDALRLLSGSSVKEKEFGLRQLAHLRNEVKAHIAEIDALTKNLQLEEVVLVEINLKGFHLQKANLLRAKLHKANLQGANLQGAILQGAILQGADLRGANLQGARYNSQTRLPKNFDPKKAGMKMESGSIVSTNVVS